MIYVCGCLLSMIISWVGVHTKCYKDGRKIGIIGFSLLPLFLISAFRYDVGTDYWFMYTPYLENLRMGIEIREIEPIFKWLNLCIIAVDGSTQWIFIISAILFLFFTYSQIFEDSPYPYMSIFLLLGMTYYFISLNAIRQMIGASILLYSIRFIEIRDLKRFLISVIIATGFHYSCLAFIVAYWLYSIKLDLLRVLFFSLSIVLMFFLLKDSAMNCIMTTSYEKYIGSDFDTGKVGYFVLLIQLTVLLFCSIFNNNSGKYRIYLWLQIISFVLASIGSVVVLVERLRWMFGLPSIILLPLAISNIRNKSERFILGFLVVILFSAYAFYTIGIKNGHETLPYKTIFGIQ